jgi:energy-coupling factor transport system ATP-binding protein
MSAVTIENLHWRYPAFVGRQNPWTLKGVNLEIRQGEFFGLTGPSGAGKTTLCKTLMGMIPHTVRIPLDQVDEHFRGSVSVMGSLVSSAGMAAESEHGAPSKIQGQQIRPPVAGMVLQDPENQFLMMSMLYEVAFGLQLLRLPREEIDQRAQEALTMVGLEHLWKRAEYIHPADLSGGQKQRVAIASFLAMRPQLLILDEPTSDLDPKGRNEVIATVQRLKEAHGLTVVLVEHDPEILFQFCDRIALLCDGRIEFVAPPAEFYANFELLEQGGATTFEVSRIAHRAGICGDRPVPATIAEAKEVLRAAEGAQVKDVHGGAGEKVIEVRDLWYRYDDGTVGLCGADLELRQGESLALLGSNGSGKTTLAKILAGIYTPWKGTCLVVGQDVHDRRVRAMLPTRIGYVFQNPDHQIFTRRVYDEVAYGLQCIGIQRDGVDERVKEALARVGLVEKVEEDPLFLGKGEKQRLAVASVLAMRPEVIVVDEPTTGQDYRMVCSIMALLEELHAAGCTVLIITHDMTLVANYCQRAVVLRGGRTVFDGTVRELFSSPENLELAQLRSPQAITLSCELRKEVPDFPLLLNEREWVEALTATKKEVVDGPLLT